MIYPRLKLAKDLLTDDGVIFISIDDNEVENLKKCCNEIFGEGNLILNISWRRTDNQPNVGLAARVKEYILIYSKNKMALVFGRLPLTEKAKKEYRYSDAKGLFRRSILLDKTRGRKFYPKITKNGNVLNGPWMVSEEEFDRMNHNNEIYWTSGGDEQPYGKIYLSDSKGQIPNDFWGIEFGTNQRASLEVEDLFKKRFFDFPKPVSLLYYLITLGTNSNDIILDFFSGSATTAHAVMQLNAEEKQSVELSIKNLDKNDPDYDSKFKELNTKLSQTGNRKFIMVQVPELTDEKSEAYKSGYKNICEIGKERIRRAGRKILEFSSESLENSRGSLEKIFVDLEKEGFIEKYARELSKIRSLEEVYGFGGAGLQLSEESTQRGNVCFIGSDETCSGINSIEHSRGAISECERVYPIFESGKGFSSRTGNTIVDLQTLEILNKNGYKLSNEFIGGNKQNDLFANTKFNEENLKTLNSKLQILHTKHQVLSSKNLDIGFRVLKCDTSNMKDVYYNPKDYDASLFDSITDNIKEDRTPEDLLFQVMLDLGISLSSKIKCEVLKVEGIEYKYFNVQEGFLFACFDNNITDVVITEIAKQKPYYFVMRDSSMASDSVATNFEQIFATYSPDTVRKVL